MTANVGIRWDIMVPFTENNNKILYVNETEPNPGAGGLPGVPRQIRLMHGLCRLQPRGHPLDRTLVREWASPTC